MGPRLWNGSPRGKALGLICLVALAGRSAGADGAGLERQLDWGGRTRRYVVHVPPGPPAPRPVLLAFHGGGGEPWGYQRYAGLDAVADREGFVVVYPAGTGRFGPRLLTWNAGGCCGYAMDHRVDDVGFAGALLDALAAELPVDGARIYATGHSNGAMMAYRLAAEASERVAAVAPVAGATPLDGFAPAFPVAVLHVHSVDDPRALYAGGLGPPFPLTRIRSLHQSVESQLARWARRNGCSEQGKVMERRVAPEGRSDAGHSATRISWSPCESGMEVELWQLSGAGHGWPGGRTRLPERVIGPETQVVDAAEEIWAFVRRFSRAPGAAPQSPAPGDGHSTGAAELPIRLP